MAALHVAPPPEYAWQYHNGGIWPFVGAFFAAALAQTGLREHAAEALAKVPGESLGDWAFTEWLHGGPTNLRHAGAVVERRRFPDRATCADAAGAVVRHRPAAAPGSSSDRAGIEQAAIERCVLLRPPRPPEGLRHAGALDRAPHCRLRKRIQCTPEGRP